MKLEYFKDNLYLKDQYISTEKKIKFYIFYFF